MDRARWIFPLALLGVLALSLPAVAEEGAFVGLDLGVSEPTNANYRAHVKTGATANPYGGYMFNDYLGLQGQFQFNFQQPDNDGTGYERQDQTSSLFGFGVGPRLELPLKPLNFPFSDRIELYTVGQGCIFTGTSGAVRKSAAGMSFGGGVDVKVMDNLYVSGFGRWNRAYTSPRPTDLGPTQSDAERYGEDIQWATAGIGVKYSFAEAPPPPPPPPPAPAPPPRVPERIVLRAVHFDFDKATVRPDAYPILDEAVEMLTTHENENVTIVSEGHADSIGSAKYNMGLSRRRAEAVRNYLVKHGIAGNRIKIQAYGETKPVASNKTAEGRAMNRRVEIRVE
jgi:outer membrane protein OmpA-like peptidoglycan-associated protein